MSATWHPLSVVFLVDLPGLATRNAVRLLLRGQSGVELSYAGDRMWPGLRHGDRVRIQPCTSTAPLPGRVVLVCPDGIPDLLRVLGAAGGSLRVGGDADPGSDLTCPEADVLGVTETPTCRLPELRRRWNRLVLDWREAFHDLDARISGPTSAIADPAWSVRAKYAAQALHYAGRHGVDIEERLLERLGERVPSGGRVLVAGCGTGRECFALARAGFRVRGVDFAPSMIRSARDAASARGLDIEFVEADLRHHAEAPGSIAALLFTYDVYSFIPEPAERVALLRSARSWLADGGVVCLSARRVRSARTRLFLTVQWAARRLGPRRTGPRIWGASHTRWIASDGSLRRSFIQVFTTRRLLSETRRAGFRMERWEGGHVFLARL